MYNFLFKIKEVAKCRTAGKGGLRGRAFFVNQDVMHFPWDDLTPKNSCTYTLSATQQARTGSGYCGSWNGADPPGADPYGAAPGPAPGGPWPYGARPGPAPGGPWPYCAKPGPGPPPGGWPIPYAR